MFARLLEGRWVIEMINKSKRLYAKHLIEKFMACEITNDDYNDEFPSDRNDPALEAIYCNVWPYYSENPTHKLDGKHALQPEARELFTRCVLFLATDLEYEWPAYKWISLKYSLMRLLRQSRRIDEQFERFKEHGDFEVWPFIRKDDYVKFAQQQGSAAR